MMMTRMGRLIWLLAAALAVSAAPGQEGGDAAGETDETQAPAPPDRDEAPGGSEAEAPDAGDDESFVPTEELSADEEVTFPVDI